LPRSKTLGISRLVLGRFVLEHMAKTKDQKKEIVEKIERAMKNAASSVFVGFTGISVADESRMRRAFRVDAVATPSRRRR